MMQPKCSTCPIAGDCVAQWTCHAPFCAWAVGDDPAKRQRVVELSAAGPEQPLRLVARMTAPAPCGGCGPGVARVYADVIDVVSGDDAGLTTTTTTELA
jgi:hypothetical protein